MMNFVKNLEVMHVGGGWGEGGNIICVIMTHWAIPEKKQTGGLRIWNFQGYQNNSMWNFQGLIKNEVEFPGLTKKK